ncbi:hypothetical protein IFM89_012063 [Coptis chinensis]|uniref:Uncharacterized protein n=1 Tax=Coptis chinensis TaxID=261450 RepID=A0A835HZC3_9MAGN|nr:hypothetical protein IFM89_012063 [Coptis chinensis]
MQSQPFSDAVTGLFACGLGVATSDEAACIAKFMVNFHVGPERSSDLFKLKQNFRTHSSVLNLAQSVLTLLCHFFPKSVDKLESETSLVHGELPVLLQSCDQNVLKNIFHSNVGNSNGVITFRAQQVILVRDDCAKEQVIEQVGKNALVLTIIKCTGLEFQDVLLYNFFEKAPLEPGWEVVYEFMVHKNLLGARSLKYPPFNKDRHSALCNELKELYVAITRTRQRLWVFESISHPLFDYWKKLGVVKLGEFDFSFGSGMLVFCKLEEWNLCG